VAQLLQVRRARQALQARSWWQAADAPGQVTAHWSTPQHRALTHEEWNSGQHRALALHLRVGQAAFGQAPASMLNADCLLLINASINEQMFNLPAGRWLRHIDSFAGAGSDQLLAAQETVPPGSLWLASTQPLFSA
jgi:pullulanase/glycogen debranching enzyme